MGKLIYVLFFITLFSGVCFVSFSLPADYNPSIGIRAINVSKPTNIVINGEAKSLSASTGYTITQNIISIRDLYQPTFPIRGVLVDAKIVSFKVYTDNSIKSYVELSDSTSIKTIKCYYWYNQLPFQPTNGLMISVWGKVWAGPKIDLEGISINRKI